jgi:hypothetical protein
VDRPVKESKDTLPECWLNADSVIRKQTTKSHPAAAHECSTGPTPAAGLEALPISSEKRMKLRA